MVSVVVLVVVVVLVDVDGGVMVVVVVVEVMVVSEVVGGEGVEAHCMQMLSGRRGVAGSLIRASVSLTLSAGASFFHFFLLCAIVQISSKDRWGGTSWKMFPSLPCAYWTFTASLSRRSPCSLNICPSHFLR